MYDSNNQVVYKYSWMTDGELFKQNQNNNITGTWTIDLLGNFTDGSIGSPVKAKRIELQRYNSFDIFGNAITYPQKTPDNTAFSNTDVRTINIAEISIYALEEIDSDDYLPLHF